MIWNPPTVKIKLPHQLKWAKHESIGNISSVQFSIKLPKNDVGASQRCGCGCRKLRENLLSQGKQVLLAVLPSHHVILILRENSFIYEFVREKKNCGMSYYILEMSFKFDINCVLSGRRCAEEIKRLCLKSFCCE